MAAGGVRANIIDFSGGSGVFDAPYTENGFTVTPLDGNLVFGSGIYDISSPYIAIEVQRSNGGNFTLNSVQLGYSQAEVYSYFLSGFLGGTEVASNDGGFFPA
jgi:hypothetical protein